MRISVKQAIDQLSSNVVAIPTETVYGLAARIDVPDAIEKVFTLKNRPRENPLIVHLYSENDLHHYTDEPVDEELLDYWPGPLTLILKCKNLPEIITAGLPTAAFRVPNHPLTLEIIKMTGPLVAPSANLSGYPSATHYKHVENDFGLNFPVVDGGMCESGLESTIIAKKQGKWRILRLGAISAEELEKKLGYKPEVVKPSSKPECPGQLFKHYSPKAKLVFKGDADAVLGFRDRNYIFPLVSFGASDDPEEIASNLYDALRSLDLLGYKTVLVDINFPRDGLYSTIYERLLKASQE